MSPQSSPTNLTTLLSSSAHSRHFLSLSTLLLLPPHHLQTLTLITTDSFPTLTTATLLLPLASFTLFTAAVGSISFFIFQGFLGRPPPPYQNLPQAPLHFGPHSPRPIGYPNLIPLTTSLTFQIRRLKSARLHIPMEGKWGWEALKTSVFFW